VTSTLAVNAVAYGAYLAAWAFFAYGPQFALCLWFAWSACRRTHGDLLNWMAIGFLWSLLPLAGCVVMWWLWRRASRGAAGAQAAT
jgi:hypothetical protein